MPTSVIKEKPSPTWKTFKFLLESVSINDPIEELFVVGIKFDYENVTEKQILFNDVLPPVFEKHKILDANQISIYQFLEHFEKTGISARKAYRCIQKSHATLFPKKYIPLYLEEIKFLVQRCRWLVTKLYLHFAFEQKAFKKKFV